MPEYIHVRFKATGHTKSIPAGRFDPARHEKTGRDPLDHHGKPVGPKYKTTATKAAEDKKTTGRKAEPQKEDG